MPRASMHLREMYNFLGTDKNPVRGLDAKKLAEFKKALGVVKVHFIRETEADRIEALFGKVAITISEEGIMVLELRKENSIGSPAQDLEFLERFFLEKFSPALKYLFSLGAPLPKELLHIRETYPAIITIKDCPEDELKRFIEKEKIDIYSRTSSKKLDFLFGAKTSILLLKSEYENMAWLLQDMVFLKEFPLQLANYVTIHRDIWEKVAKIREAKTIKYRDLAGFREQISAFLKTLSLMKARLNQMDDIIEARKEIIKEAEAEELNDLKINRMHNFIGDIRYVEDLWDMTIDYTKDTLNLIESLSQENIQRELRALKFITLISAITGFFGMNIAFPWEERWPAVFRSSFAVIGIIIFVAVAFYYFLKLFIYKRTFKLKLGIT